MDHWDFIFVHALHERLDHHTAREWELARSSDQPTAMEITKFLDKEAGASKVQSMNERKQLTVVLDNRQPKGNIKGATAALGKRTGTIPKQQECEACGGGQYHPLFKCPNFLSLNVNARKEFITRRRICANCLQKGHSKEFCADRLRCGYTQCQNDPAHNSLLCPVKQGANRTAMANSATIATGAYGSE